MALLRRLFPPLLSYLYRFVSRRLRRNLAKVPGVLPLYRYVVNPFLYTPSSENDLVVCKFHGFEMYAEPQQITGSFFLGLWEPTTTFVFKRVLAAGDVVIDVGAHWGYFTLLAATLCGDTGKVFAFEAHPINYSLLMKNIGANRLTSLLAVQKAISNQTGTAKLLLARSSVSHSLKCVPPEFSLPPHSKDHVIVDTITLDDFFAQNPVQPKLIKMDIEGAEPLALEGMKTIIEQNHDLVLITEFLPHYLGAHAAEDFLRRLSAYSFELTIIDDDRYELDIGSTPQILKRALQNLQKGCPTNLLCTRDRALLETLIGKQDSRSMTHGVPRVVYL